jgi:hypothetical protein
MRLSIVAVLALTSVATADDQTGNTAAIRLGVAHTSQVHRQSRGGDLDGYAHVMELEAGVRFGPRLSARGFFTYWPFKTVLVLPDDLFFDESVVHPHTFHNALIGIAGTVWPRRWIFLDVSLGYDVADPATVPAFRIGIVAYRSDRVSVQASIGAGWVVSRRYCCYGLAGYIPAMIGVAWD